MGTGYAVTPLGKCPAGGGSRRPVPTMTGCCDENAVWMRASLVSDDGREQERCVDGPFGSVSNVLKMCMKS